MSGRYSREELDKVAYEKSSRAMPEEEYQEDSQILRDLGIVRLAHRNAIIDEAYRQCVNVVQLRESAGGWKWFQDTPVEWLLGAVAVRPSTIWTLEHVAAVRDKRLYDCLSDYGIFIQIADGNFLTNFINRRSVKRFERIFAPIIIARKDDDLPVAWKQIADQLRKK